MSLDRTLARARAAFERRMRATCVIDRPTTERDVATGKDITTYGDVYSGRCYTRYPGLAFESTFDSAGVTVVQSKAVVRVPLGTAYRPGDRVTITADPDNPRMVGTVLRVTSADDMSQASSQRLLCDDYQAGVAGTGA